MAAARCSEAIPQPVLMLVDAKLHNLSPVAHGAVDALDKRGYSTPSLRADCLPLDAALALLADDVVLHDQERGGARRDERAAPK